MVAAGEVGADQSDGAARDGECVDLFVADDGAKGKCNDGDEIRGDRCAGGTQASSVRDGHDVGETGAEDTEKADHE